MIDVGHAVLHQFQNFSYWKILNFCNFFYIRTFHDRAFYVLWQHRCFEDDILLDSAVSPMFEQLPMVILAQNTLSSGNLLSMHKDTHQFFKVWRNRLSTKLRCMCWLVTLASVFRKPVGYWYQTSPRMVRHHISILQHVLGVGWKQALVLGKFHQRAYHSEQWRNYCNKAISLPFLNIVMKPSAMPTQQVLHWTSGWSYVFLTNAVFTRFGIVLKDRLRANECPANIIDSIELNLRVCRTLVCKRPQPQGHVRMDEEAVNRRLRTPKNLRCSAVKLVRLSWFFLLQIQLISQAHHTCRNDQQYNRNCFNNRHLKICFFWVQQN